MNVNTEGIPQKTKSIYNDYLCNFSLWGVKAHLRDSSHLKMIKRLTKLEASVHVKNHTY